MDGRHIFSPNTHTWLVSSSIVYPFKAKSLPSKNISHHKTQRTKSLSVISPSVYLLVSSTNHHLYFSHRYTQGNCSILRPCMSVSCKAWTTDSLGHYKVLEQRGQMACESLPRNELLPWLPCSSLLLSLVLLLGFSRSPSSTELQGLLPCPGRAELWTVKSLEVHKGFPFWTVS